MTKLIYCVSFFVLVAFHGLKAATFVNGEEDFLIHMKNHVQNVRVLADILLDLAEKDPAVGSTLGLSPGQKITPELKAMAREFIAVHDASKVNFSKEFLKRHHANRPFIKDLFSVYGKKYSEMSSKEKFIIEKQINGTDLKERELFIQKNLPDQEQMKFLDAIEKMADGVERGSNPLTSEEMAKKVLLLSEIQEKDLGQAKTVEQINELKNKIQLTKKLEEIYPQVATHYVDYKDKTKKFGEILKKAGVFEEYLDEYSKYQLMSDFEELKGRSAMASSDINKLAEDYRQFLFDHEEQLKKVQLMLKTSKVNEGLMMLEFVKIEHSKSMNIPYNSRYNRLFETLAGECGK